MPGDVVPQLKLIAASSRAKAGEPVRPALSKYSPRQVSVPPEIGDQVSDATPPLLAGVIFHLDKMIAVG